MTYASRSRRLVVLTGLLSTLTLSAAQSPVEKLTDGVRIAVGGGFLRLQVESDTIVRVLFSKTKDPRVDTMVVIGAGQDQRERDLNPFVTPGTPSSTTIGSRSTWTSTSTATAAIIKTPKLIVTVALKDGAVTFADATNKVILAETPGMHAMTPATIQGEQTFGVQQRWQSTPDESLYGLGQRQEGKLDLKGYDFDLWQRNTVVEIPFLVSSRGYGILWDNTSFTKFGDPRPFEAIPAANLVDASGTPGGLSAGTFLPGNDQLQDAAPTAAIALGRVGGAPVPATPPAPAAAASPSRATAPPAVGGSLPGNSQAAPAAAAGRGRGGPAPGVRGWTGEVIAPVTGDYQFQTYSNLEIKVWLDNQLRIDHWKQNWATENDQFKVHLEAGKHYPIKITASQGATMRLLWKTPAPTTDTSFWSEVGEAIDYHFVYGPEPDQIVAGYRTLTGQASMLPKWAFGFWQSKNKYNTQAEVLNTLAEFRRRQIPIDTIVQDWQYWQPDSWGTHQFEASRYPDPDGMIKTIHDQHARFMISVWGKFYPGVENAKALNAIGALYQPTLTAGTRDWLQRGYTFYDAFNKPARKMFWDQVSTALFSKGVDAWWMDATEPDIVQPSPPTLELLRGAIDKTAIGTASRVMNAYSLVNSEAVYDGQRSVAPNQRAFILTRSGFAGIQRYATVTWSGDITSEWSTLRKQITAGLNFSIAGDPYWTTDTGGYTMQGRFTSARDGDALDEWRELNARWFEYSTFCPILRVHGADRPREMWNIGEETTPVYEAELKYDSLRYALFPYIYSVSGDVTQDGYTLMRPLVMDFRADVAARNVTDEFMFGPSILVSPVTTYKARTRSVYLPAGSAWYHFWTGKPATGGQTVTAAAAYDQIPLYLRAGSILPVGPAQQYIGEHDAKSLTLYVYAGANGKFSLYEDDGLTYDYERRQFSRIPFTWTEATKTLTIGARTGTFSGMLADRTFNVVVVSSDHPVGYAATSPAGKTVAYSGATVQVKF